MTEAPRTVWVTKYALTAGVKQHPIVRLEEDGDLWAKLPGSPSYGALIGPKDHHPTREAALARAEEMRAAKIASLKRQIERLENLEF
jgi:hypothetical protein